MKLLGNPARHDMIGKGEFQQRLIVAAELDLDLAVACAEADAIGRGHRKAQRRNLRRRQLPHDGRRRGVVPGEQVEAVVGAHPVGDSVALETLRVGPKIDGHQRCPKGLGMRLDGEGQVEVLDPGRDQHVPVAIVHGDAAPNLVPAGLLAMQGPEPHPIDRSSQRPTLAELLLAVLPLSFGRGLEATSFSENKYANCDFPADAFHVAYGGNGSR